MKGLIVILYLLACCVPLCSAEDTDFRLAGIGTVDIAAPQAAIPAPQPPATASADLRGPLIRLSSISLTRSALEFEGYAEDAASDIASFALRAAGDPAGTYSAVPALDWEFDSSMEGFSIAVQNPQSGSLRFRIRDAFGNESVLRLELTVRPDYQGYVLYLSTDALGAAEEGFDNFTIYYTSSVPTAHLKETRERLLSLKQVADQNLGFKNYHPTRVMLYMPGEAATFKYFRGHDLGGVFTFPIPAPSVAPGKFNSTLDAWIPHELGDWSTRDYANTSLIRWLSEGTGDYLAHLYTKRYFPEESHSYLARVEIFKGMYGEQDMQVNLLDGKFGPQYYLCSVAHVFGIAKAHGPSVLHELFSSLNLYAPEAATEAAARKILGTLTGRDITAEISAFSTAQAIKTLEDFDK